MRADVIYERMLELVHSNGSANGSIETICSVHESALALIQGMFHTGLLISICEQALYRLAERSESPRLP